MKSYPPRHVLLSSLLCLVLGATSLAGAGKKPEVSIDWGGGNQPPATVPLPPPPALDAKYSADALLAAFRLVAKQLRVPIRRLAVDTSEYPFLVHGLLGARCSHDDMRRVLQTLPGYAYAGSTTMINSSGSTFFALNMTPASTYPADHRSVIRERLGPRLKGLLNRELGR